MCPLCPSPKSAHIVVQLSKFKTTINLIFFNYLSELKIFETINIRVIYLQLTTVVDYYNEGYLKNFDPFLCFSFSLLFRCVPYPDKENLNTSQQIIKKFVEVFELDDLFRKVLNDVYVCWREMLALCGIAVSK